MVTLQKRVTIVRLLVCLFVSFYFLLHMFIFFCICLLFSALVRLFVCLLTCLLACLFNVLICLLVFCICLYVALVSCVACFQLHCTMCCLYTSVPLYLVQTAHCALVVVVIRVTLVTQ